MSVCRGGGVNLYGQPDRKISVFFDDLPYVTAAIAIMQIDLWLCRCWLRLVIDAWSDGDNVLGKPKDKR